MIEYLGQNKDKYQTKMLLHQLIKMTLADTDPSITSALDEFAVNNNFQRAEYEEPLPKNENKVVRPEPI